ncbi:bacterial proteasome activator family protein [Solicola gregarius]|uniref:Bacterial proteasome activator n=1 Tax=Solicola gregarius TaxID=2908642 RepID=A0AA46YPH0_9ACTN|nr:bacterial proteasome activator family protein [Solicola gregarius]UYM07603.1 bacterial proteasome activator family protein [Solicola gregarius]
MTDKPSEHTVIGPDGRPVAVPADDEHEPPSVTDLVEQPAKVMRIGSMIRQLLEEVKAAPLDDASRARLREIHTTSIKELEDGLAPELIEELERLSLPFGSATPSESELRIAQAQLVGWLEGLFHGIQTAIYAQQMAAQSQLQQIRRALPGGAEASGQPPYEGGDAEPGGGRGMYL